MNTFARSMALSTLLVLCGPFALAGDSPVKYNELDYEETRVILQKGTEMPFSGEYEENWARGTYLCKRCNAPLYESGAKFNARCGWPSFDDDIPAAVKRTTDADGRRTEITCANCGGHLGHVFLSEGYTKKNTRHCVNSISMIFISDGEKLPALITEKPSQEDLKED